MNISSDRLLLNEITKDDVPIIHQLQLLPEIDEYNTLGIPKDLSETQQNYQCYFDDQKKVSRKMFCWSIRLKSTLKFIGVAGMSLTADRFNMGEIYYKLFPEFWGKGYATETACTLVHFGFETLHLHRIEAGVATENKQSIRVLEKSGMTQEGIRRKILPIRGQWVDNYHYAIVEDDPRPGKA